MDYEQLYKILNFIIKILRWLELDARLHADADHTYLGIDIWLH